MKKTAKSLWSRGENDRWAFLSRAREAAKVTLPFLVPPQGHSGVSALPTPYQGLGARGVNNLASKLMLGLLPPNNPWFRLVIDDPSLAQGGLEEFRTEIDLALSRAEQALMDEMETSNLRPVAFELFRHLIVAGNGLLYIPEDGYEYRFYPLENYVVDRDSYGNILSIVTKDCVARDALDGEIREAIERQHPMGSDHEVDVYTVVCREEKKFKTWQEIADIVVPGSEGTYTDDTMPYVPLRWNSVSTESYGRGMVEEYLGDLLSLEALSQAIVEGSAAAAKVVFMVNPNGLTRARKIAESPNGAVIDGVATDVSTLQMDKFADFRVALETINQIRDRLGYAFLLNTSIQRAGERVTATEVRMMAQELEDALGGVYSSLSQEFQYPLVQRVMSRMQRQKRFPKFPKDVVRPMVVTGVQALGRGQDLMKLDLFVTGLSQTLGPEAMQFLNIREYLERRAIALAIDTRGLVKTDEELQQEMEQAQQMQMMQSLGPSAIGAGAKMMEQGAAGEQLG